MNHLARLIGLGGPATQLPGVSAQEARRMQQTGAQLIDVREPHEFRSGHAANAKNIPLGHLSQRMSEMNKDRPVLLICQSGRRSSMAQEQLAQHQFTDTYNVNGGTIGWRAASLPME